MFIRIIFATIIVYAVYRLWKRAGRKEHVETTKSDVPGEMVACSRCGTFIIGNEAIYSHGNVYCSEGCLKGN